MRPLSTSVVVGIAFASLVGCAATPRIEEAARATSTVVELRAVQETSAVREKSTVAHTRAEVAAAFTALKALVGPWEGTTSAGRTSRVGYRISAGESVVVETWTQSRGREALTIYHVDGEELLATHYCPKGNAVRLRWSDGELATGMNFEFVDGTNLDDAKQSHQRTFRLEFDGANAYRRGETYVANASTKAEIAAQPAGEIVAYRRVETETKPG